MPRTGGLAAPRFFAPVLARVDRQHGGWRSVPYVLGYRAVIPDGVWERWPPIRAEWFGPPASVLAVDPLENGGEKLGGGKEPTAP